MQHELIWQPLSSSNLSIFELAVDTALIAIEQQWILLDAAIQSQRSLYTDISLEPIAIDKTHLYLLMIYAEQGRHWHKLNPTGALRQQLDGTLVKITQAMIVNAKVNTVLALLRAMGMYSQNKEWLIAIRMMLLYMGNDTPTKAFEWADTVLQQQNWTIGQQSELRRLSSLVCLAYNEVSEALWETKVALALWRDRPNAVDDVTHTQLYELMIQCWLRQEDDMNATDAAMKLVAFVDMGRDRLFMQPQGQRLWLDAAYYRAFVAEFAFDYPTAAMWYAEAQQRSHMIALATHHPMRQLIDAGMARVR